MKMIAWDVDDVLNDLMGEWLEKGWAAERPDLPLRLDQIIENPPQRLLGIPAAEYLQSLDRFRLGAGDSLMPVPEVLSWFGEYGERFHHVAISAVPRRAAHVSASWVVRHFGRWMPVFCFVPSPRPGEPAPNFARSKVEVMRWARADVLVDDNPTTIGELEAAGLEGILWPRTWNAGCGSRPEILQELLARFG
jgi:hypothetical protein